MYIYKFRNFITFRQLDFLVFKKLYGKKRFRVQTNHPCALCNITRLKSYTRRVLKTQKLPLKPQMFNSMGKKLENYFLKESVVRYVTNMCQ
jgi:hypothetical protein